MRERPKSSYLRELHNIVKAIRSSTRYYCKLERSLITLQRKQDNLLEKISKANLKYKVIRKTHKCSNRECSNTYVFTKVSNGYCKPCTRSIQSKIYANSVEVEQSLVKSYDRLIDTKVVGVGRQNLTDSRYNSIKGIAKRRNKPFDLTKEQYFQLIKDDKCHYCNKSNSLPTQSMALDRKDSNIGYTFTNVVPCCTRCNTLKSVLSYEESKQWIQFLLAKNLYYRTGIHIKDYTESFNEWKLFGIIENLVWNIDTITAIRLKLAQRYGSLEKAKRHIAEMNIMAYRTVSNILRLKNTSQMPRKSTQVRLINFINSI